MCLYPTLIRNRKYTKTKKNGGNIPPIIDQRVKYVPIGCQRCIECVKQKARGWQLRLLEDIKTNTNGKFITLTFSNESILKLTEENDFGEAEAYELDNALATRAIRLFLERWRKRFKKSVRHFFITELGHEGTENIHLHGILWTNETFDTIKQIWQYGYIWPKKDQYKQNYVSERTVNYIIKYITKRDSDHPNYTPKVLTSPGIGNQYTNGYAYLKNKFNGTDTIETYRTSTGHQIAIPIYWRNKIYTEQEREQLWLQRLDRNERWICGEMIPADDDKQIYGLLQWYRRKNKRLGYGSDEKNWQQEKYERERRRLLQATRIKNAREKLALKSTSFTINVPQYNINNYDTKIFIDKKYLN